MPENASVGDSMPSHGFPEGVLPELDSYLSEAQQAGMPGVQPSESYIEKIDDEILDYAVNAAQWIDQAAEGQEDERERQKYMEKSPEIVIGAPKEGIEVFDSKLRKRHWTFTDAEKFAVALKLKRKEIADFQKKLDEFDEQTKKTFWGRWLGGPIRTAHRWGQRATAPAFSATDLGYDWLEKRMHKIFGVGDFLYAFQLREAFKAIDQGTATPHQIHLAAEHIATMEALEKQGMAGKARDLVADSIPFALEMIITGPFAHSYKRAVAQTYKAALQKTTRELIETTARKTLGKTGTKIAAKTSLEAAGAFARTSYPTSWGHILAGIEEGQTEYKLPVEYQGPDGKKLLALETIKAKKSLSKSIRDAFLDQYIEVLTETLGFQAGEAIGKASKLVPKRASRVFARNRIADTMLAWWIRKGRKPGDLARRVATTAGFDSVLEEMYEERLGEILRGMVGIETDGVIPSLKDRNFAKAFHQLGIELLGFGAMGTAGGLTSAALSGSISEEQKKARSEMMRRAGEYVMEQHRWDAGSIDRDAAAYANEYVRDSASYEKAREFVRKTEESNPGVEVPTPSRKIWREYGPGFQASADTRRQIYRAFKEMFVDSAEQEVFQDVPENDRASKYQELEEFLNQRKEYFNAQGTARQADETSDEARPDRRQAQGVRVRDIEQDRGERIQEEKQEAKVQKEGYTPEEVRKRIEGTQKDVLREGLVSEEEVSNAMDAFKRKIGDESRIEILSEVPSELREHKEFLDLFPETKVFWFRKKDKKDQSVPLGTTYGRVMFIDTDPDTKGKTRDYVVWRIVGDEISHSTGADSLDSIFSSPVIQDQIRRYYKQIPKESRYRAFLDKLRESNPNAFNRRMAREATAALISEMITDENVREAIRRKDEGLFKRIIRAIVNFFKGNWRAFKALTPEQKKVVEYLQSQLGEGAVQKRAESIGKQLERYRPRKETPEAEEKEEKQQAKENEEEKSAQKKEQEKEQPEKEEKSEEKEEESEESEEDQESGDELKDDADIMSEEELADALEKMVRDELSKKMESEPSEPQEKTQPRQERKPKRKKGKKQKKQAKKQKKKDETEEQSELLREREKLIEEVTKYLAEEGFEAYRPTEAEEVQDVRRQSEKVNAKLLSAVTRLVANYYKGGVREYSDYFDRIREDFPVHIIYDANTYFETAWNSLMKLAPSAGLRPAVPLRPLLEELHDNGEIDLSKSKAWSLKSGKKSKQEPAEPKGKKGSRSGVSGKRSRSRGDQQEEQGGRGADESGPSDGADVEEGEGDKAESDRSGDVSASEREDAESGEVRDNPVSDGQDYRAREPEDLVGATGQTGKLKQNLEALEILKKIIAEGRSTLSDKERSALVKFMGWGQFPQVFQISREDALLENWRAARRHALPEEWRPLVKRLAELMSDEEWESARESTPNAHFTAPEVIQAMWKIGHHLGYQGGGKVLEPSAGMGWFAALEDSQDPSQWTMVELDDISAKIISLLYPNSKVVHSPFERAQFRPDYFDVAIGNPPFSGRERVKADPAYRKMAPLLHDYFILKSLDYVRPGGIAMFVTSTGTMDKATDIVRRAIDKKADLLGAFRLPETAFKKYAGTQVVTDVLIFRKRKPGEERHPSAQSWIRLGEVEDAAGVKPISVNEYYVEHPEHILGTIGRWGTMYGPPKKEEINGRIVEVRPMTVRSDKDNPVDDETIKMLLESLPEDAYSPLDVDAEVSRGAAAFDDTGKLEAVKEGTSKKIYLWSGDHKTEVTSSIKRAGLTRPKVWKIVSAYQNLRDAYRDVVTSQLLGKSDETKENARKKLNQTYDAFMEESGRPLNSKEMETILSIDHDFYRVQGIEQKEKGKWTKGDIFFKDTLSQPEQKKPKTIEDARALSLNVYGNLQVRPMAEWLGKSEDEVVKELVDAGLAFIDPTTGHAIDKEEYLSGQLAYKFEEAERAAEKDSQFKKNVEALRKVMPKWKQHHEIATYLGDGLLTLEELNEFANYYTGYPGVAVKISQTPDTGEYAVSIVEHAFFDSDFNQNILYQTGRNPRTNRGGKTYAFLLKHALQGSYPTISREGVIDRQATENAAEIIDQIQSAYERWVWSNPQRREQIVRRYNLRIASWKDREYDGSHMTFPGMIQPGTKMPRVGRVFEGLRPAQRSAAWRIVTRGRAGIFHQVGLGKTIAYIAAAMELKRLGKARKVAIVVRNNLVQNIYDHARDLYPNAKVKIVKVPQSKAGIQKAIGEIAARDWDILIFNQKSFKNLKLSPKTQRAYVESLVDEYRQILMAEGVNPDSEEELKKASRTSLKVIVASIRNFRQKLSDLIREEEGGPTASFEDTGIDYVMVDEAHDYKNVPLVARGLGNVKGMPEGKGSALGVHLSMIADYLHSTNGGRGIVLGTGTPVTNTLAELYIMQRYIQPDVLEASGVRSFSNWLSMFAQIEEAIEATHRGTMDRVIRLRSFHNLRDLRKMAAIDFDIRFADEDEEIASRLQIPKVKEEPVVIPAGESLKEYMEEIRQRAENMPEDKRIDNHLKLATDGTKAGIDLRLVKEDNGDQVSKLDVAAKKIAKIRKEDDRAAQLVFMETSKSEETGWSAVDHLVGQLEKNGIPRDRIAVFFGVDNKERSEMANKLRTGELWVGIGSTKTMGTGLNVQNRLKALHHIEPAWTPENIEQRNGRMIRSGNLYGVEGEEVYNYVYLVKSPIDQWRWSVVSKKQDFIQSFMRGENFADEVEWQDDLDMFSNFAIFEALASEDPNRIKKWNAENYVAKHARRYDNYLISQREAQAAIPELEDQVKASRKKLQTIGELKQRWDDARKNEKEVTFTTRDGKEITDKKKIDEYLRKAVIQLYYETSSRPFYIGQFRGLHLGLQKQRYSTLRGSREIYLTVHSTKESPTAFSVSIGYEGAQDIISTNYLSRAIGSRLSHRRNALFLEVRHYENALSSNKNLVETPYPKLKELEKWIRQLIQYNRASGFAENDGIPPAAERIYKKVLATEEVKIEDTDEELPEAARDPFEDLRVPNKRVEERQVKADGLPDMGILERFKRTAAELAHSFRQHKHIPEGFWFSGVGNFFKRKDDRIPVAELRRHWAVAREWFRLLKEIPTRSARNAEVALNHVLSELRQNEREYFLFSRIVLMRNLVASLERGEPARFGFGEDENGNWLGRDVAYQEALDYLKQLESHLPAHPRVQRALEKRTQMVQDMARKLYEAKLLPADAVEKAEAYYHQQVLTYYEAVVKRTAGGPRAELTKKSFQMRRSEGEVLPEEYDYNTNYFEAELAWLYDANYQLILTDHLKKLAQAFDIMPELRRKAKERNRTLVVGGEAIEYDIDTALELKAAQRSKDISADEFITFGKQLAAKYVPVSDKETVAATHGDLSRMLYKIDPLHEFRVRKARAKAMLIREVGHDPILENPDDAGQLLKRIRYYAKNGSKEAQIAALSYLKAQGEETKKIKELLEDSYQTWQTIYEEIKDSTKKHGGFTLWYPKPGNMFYRAFSIPEKVYELIIQSQAEGMPGAMVGADDVSTVMAIGGKQSAMMLPTPIVDQLNSLKKRRESDWHYVPFYAKKVASAWKLQKILAPQHVLGYWARNQFGDLEPVVSGHPGVLKYMPKAARYLLKMYKDHKQGVHPKGVVAEALAHGVIDSGFVAQEVPKPSEIAGMSRLPVKGPLSALRKAWRGYWGSVTWANEFRENLLRLASYMYFKEHLDAGTLTHYGASTKEHVEEVQAIFGNAAAAANLSRNLIGDYGAISPFGEFMRNYVAYFWSWTEVNTRRWPRIIMNGWQWGMKTGKSPSTKIALSTVGVLAAFQMYFLTYLWNWLFFGDEEDELTDFDRSQPHINLGRGADGNPIILRRVSALGDFLEWFGVPTMTSRFPDYKDGQITFTELMQESAKDPVNKVAQTVSPFVKWVGEIPTGTSSFPDVFNPRKVDRLEHMLGAWDLGDPYRALRGVVLDDGSRPRPGTITGSVYHAAGVISGKDPYEKPHLSAPLRMIGVTEAARYAMFDAYSLRDRFLKKHNESIPKPNPYWRYMRDAAHYGDFTAFQQARDRWIREKLKNPRYANRPGDVYESYRSSLRRMDPVAGGMSEEMAAKFYEWLTPRQRERVRLGQDYARKLALQMDRWWRRAAENDPPEWKQAFDEKMGIEIARKVEILSRPRPAALTAYQRKKGLKLADLQNRWEKDAQEARQWLQDRGVTRNRALAEYRKYLQRSKVMPKTRMMKLGRVRRNLADLGTAP